MKSVFRILAMTLVLVVAGGVLLHAMAAKKPAAIPIQTVNFKSATLPVTVVITPTGGGLSYDIYSTYGACTQNPASQPGYARVAFQTTDVFTEEISKYGKYCFISNAWDLQTGTLLTATVYTTVNVTAK